jgi:hypothetical protein
MAPFTLSRESLDLILTASSLMLAALALHYTIQGYILKLGASIRGAFYIMIPGVTSDDAYVSEIALENLKDRPIVIFKIYLRLGYNNYVLIEDRSGNPLVLEPFGTYISKYDPIDQYGYLFFRLRLNKLLLSRKIPRKLILVTTQGRYTIKAQMITSGIEHDICNTDLTLVAHPMRITHKGRAYGGRVMYLVDCQKMNGQEEVVPIYPNDHIFEKFPGFFLTAAALESKEKLEDFLKEKMTNGNLSCRAVNVIDMREHLKWRYNPEENPSHEAVDISLAKYLVHEVFLGRLVGAVRYIRAIRSKWPYDQ